MHSHSIVPDWTRAGGEVAPDGILRESSDDFAVTEVLGFDPDGTGEHDFLLIEKRDTNTAWLARKLAAFADIPARDVGYSGLKDRHAVTLQWFSVRRPGGTAANWQAFDAEGVRLLDVSRNSRKLRRGAHAGNSFRIVVRALRGNTEQLDSDIAVIVRDGVPNYFGEQRFGHDGGNVELAKSLFGGKHLPREKRSIALSAARSWLFNHYLQMRVQDQTWQQLGIGQLAALDGSASVFEVIDVDATLRDRSAALDVHPTGPMWGSLDHGVRREPLEIAIREQFPDIADGLEKHTRASRRSLRLAVKDLKWSLFEDSLTLEFYLTRGSYATAVLRELVNY